MAPTTSKSLIEQAVSVTSSASVRPERFTNTYPLWLPPTARGIYGGTFISQSLSAAQSTVPADFTAHSIQSQFVRAGTYDKPLVYDVDRVSDGRSFAVRSVKILQKGQVVFVAIVGLTRASDQTSRAIAHAEPMPPNVPRPSDEISELESALDPRPTHHRGAYVTKRVGITKSTGSLPERRIHQWFKSRHPLSSFSGLQVQQAALAYMCDNYLIQAAPHVNRFFDFVRPPQSEADIGGRDLAFGSRSHDTMPASDREKAEKEGRPRIGMMVSLSHTMYFHHPKHVKVDQWMLSEVGSYWTGDGRGLATQKIWSSDGVLLASSYQEGVIRLAEDDRDIEIGRLENKTSNSKL
ncbi:acyl-CoA thioesterase II [Cyphellophora europaea CBS 101466]|uniref:Acyl-CoA thioesterase II n=1 Tax=Cyphellophora europaea (strain CBS 101466) TaxID=1220924 RepID=W2S0U0_CYPE1|nr:acyl-CoA thioesterase II [Cyphellophora europaea CBS 101466]ETN41663.1 acyl-CoA thioesterase II [Cyphellophora europaea CBS 101466]